MKKLVTMMAVALTAVTALNAAVKFDNLNINSNNVALFTVKHDALGAKSYSTLYALDLSKTPAATSSNIPDLLTCYPEYLEVFDGGKTLQVRNCYGTAMYNFSTMQLKWLARTGMLPEKASHLSPVVASPDGKWCLFMRKVSSSQGELIVENTQDKRYVILDAKANYSYTKVPVKWSSDSKKFIYEKNDSLYFCQPELLFAQVQIAEKYRRIGRGKIGNVQWCTNDKIMYIDSDIIYSIDSHELSALGMYAGIMNPGKIIGRLSQKFIAGQDVFYTNPESNKLIIIKNNNIVSYYNLNLKEPSAFVQIQDIKSFKDSYSNTFNFEVYWKAGKTPVIWTVMNGLEAKPTAAVYYINDENVITKVLDIQEYDANPALSPDGTLLAVAGKNTVHIFETAQWQQKTAINTEKSTFLVWRNNRNLIIGGEETVRQWDTASVNPQVLFLSAAENSAWDSVTGSVTVKCPSYEHNFLYNAKNNTWFASSAAVPYKKCIQNEKYRIFTGTAKNAHFENALYVRSLEGKAATYAVFKDTMNKTPARKKIALIFDAIDNADGVNTIISICRSYGLECTFFINGEFIRRYPEETRLIAANGFECASMFYTAVDLTGKEFKFDEEYIRRGLARNEDEFFNCTGKELSLLWHAPYYKTSKLIKETGYKAGYGYVDFPTDVDSIDSKAGKTLESQIIPITVGFSYNSLDENFAEKLEMLINTLIDADYEIVPASKL